MKKIYILLVIGFALSSTLTAFYITSNQTTINNAKELKINASDIGEGWEESFSYIDNPIETLEEFYKKTGEIEFEISELKKNSVKDGYLLILKRENPKSLVEVDVFVFESIDGANEFFKYVANESGVKNWKTLEIGDETVFRSTETSYIWLSRTSNAFIRIISWDGEDIGKIIVERILERVRR